MISLLLGFIKVIILLGSLITLHEFGHFIVAKMCKMKVLKFSIGFGPKILYKQGKQTEYSLRAFPIGGFVQLEGEDNDSKDPDAFSNKPIWQRLLVLLAGVTMNIAIALLIYICIYMSINYYTTNVISGITKSEILAEYGLESGDIIYKVNGKKIYNYYDILRIVSSSKKDEFEFSILKVDGKKTIKRINIPMKDVGYLGVSFNVDTMTAADIYENSAGSEAGIMSGDKIVAINGNVLKTLDKYLEIIHDNPNKEITMSMERNGNVIDLKVTPKAQKKRVFSVNFVEVYDLGFSDNLYYAWRETKSYIKANVEGILEIFSGKAENVELTGIVGISVQISQTERLIEFFYLMSAISLSLGIMNLLPIPGLDGGKLLITIIELFRRKPMSKETEAKITLIGFAFLLILMVYVTASDISNLIR